LERLKKQAMSFNSLVLHKISKYPSGKNKINSEVIEQNYYPIITSNITKILPEGNEDRL
jgi:hypothetical protein